MFHEEVNLEKYLYHYTSYTTLLEKILPTQQLRFSPFRNTNDPRETKEWGFQPLPSSTQPESEEFYEVSKQLNSLWKDNCKLICFTRDNPSSFIPLNIGRGFTHSRMWAQYAGNHTGVCLVFDRWKLQGLIEKALFKKGKFYHGPVRYGSDLLKIFQAFQLDFKQLSRSNLNDFAWNHLERYVDELFFEKLDDWKEEWEYRWVLFSKDRTDYEFVNYQDALDSIILGLDFPSVYDPLIESYCKKYKVSAYRMLWFNKFTLVPMYDNETGNNIFSLPF